MTRDELRLALLGAVAWAAALVGFALPGNAGWLLLALAAVPLLRWAGGAGVAVLLIAATALLVTQVEIEGVRHSAVARLARADAAVSVEVVVESTPIRRHRRFGDQVRFTATTVAVTARGRRYRTRARVLVFVDGSPTVAVGERLRVRGSLRPSTSPDLAAMLMSRGPPYRLAGPGALARASGRVRDAIRAASSGLGLGAAALVPALVDGDATGGAGTGAFTPAFQTAGMTHLLAVSGTNLTLILGALLLLARWFRVRTWGLAVVGVLGVGGFVLLAGPQPSVLRAAVMGTIALAGLGHAGRAQGVRALGLGVLVLVLIDPWLARSTGFVLSVIATAGILVLAPPWREALRRWLPRWAAEAVAVPLAAQVACTPVIAAISGQVSLVAVAANILAAPLVGPATVLGLAGGVVALLSEPLGGVIAVPAGWCADGIIAVAERAAAMPVPALPWSTTAVAVGVLALLCVLVALVLRAVLVRRWLTLSVVALTAVLVLVPLPTPGWPPTGWVFVACDVGQGDALAVNTGPHSAVVVDAGPDPVLVDQCLQRLGVRTVPVVVITHFHADHVDGIAGVLRGRQVGQILISPLADPPAGARKLHDAADRAGIPVRVPAVGERFQVGAVRWQVLGPIHAQPPGSDSPPNDASLVLLVETAGIRLLLMGDEERPSQTELHQAWPDLRADVLKVAHHGSSKQDPDLVKSVGARVAVISVGLNNDYGHPAQQTLDLLTSARMRVLRTDRDGDVAMLVDRAGQLATQVRPRPMTPAVRGP